MKLLNILLSTLLSLSLVSGFHDQFHHFIQRYNRSYSDIYEYTYRSDIFSQNLKTIQRYNSLNLSFTLAINEFADLTSDEFANSRNLLFSNQHPKSPSPFVPQNIDNLPTALDWRVPSGNPKGLIAVTPIKNQEQCGSCWSFSASGATEGAWAISTGKLVSLSEQQLIDCSSSFGNNGCNGGDMDSAFQYIQQAGLCTEASYPYQAADGTCKKCTPIAHLNGYIDIPDETSILQEIQKGPVSIGLEADQSVFQFYSGGVLDDSSCGTQLDHGVLIVGYGEDSGKPYWIVKNSWGSDWGESGYIRIVRAKGMCGIGQMQSRPYYSNKLDSGLTCAEKLSSVFSCGDDVPCIVVKAVEAVVGCESYVCPRLPSWMRTPLIVPVCYFYCQSNSC